MSPMYPPPAPVTADSASALTVSMYLKNPTLIRRRISDLAARRDYTGFIFGDGGEAVSGAAAFQVATENVFTSQTDVEKIAPGAEYPKIEFDAETLATVSIDKYGGAFDVTDEMRDRNQMGLVEQRQQLLVNATILKVEALALSVLTAGIATHGRSGSGSSWADAGALTQNTRLVADPISDDLATMQMKPEEEQTPYEYSLLIANPQEWKQLVAQHGNAQKVRDYLDGFGIKNTWVTSLQTAGKAKFVAPGMVGLKFHEGAKGVQSKTYRDENRDTDVIKAWDKPAFGVTDPLAVYELTDLAA